MATKRAPSRTLPAPALPAGIHEQLLSWYREVRRDLPWRRTRDPYSVWLSEVMLQQTRVDTVVPYYERFLARWPTVHALAEAPLDHVLAAWSGLGYYRRARMLHAAAQQVASERAGIFPAEAASLAEIHGIGRYTAGAVASIAFGARAALVDGNVARVLARLFAFDEDLRGPEAMASIWELAERLVRALPPAEDPGAWNQALMELGATVCTPRNPRCLFCPLRESCAARASGRENEIPVLKPKPKARLERRVAFAVVDGGAVLLGRRRRELRFGGLWEPPSFVRGEGEGVAEALGALERCFGVAPGPLREVGVVKHVLSHRRLEVTVLVGALPTAARRLEDRGGEGHPLPASVEGHEYDAYAWVSPDERGGRGRSTLAEKVLALAGHPGAVR